MPYDQARFDDELAPAVRDWVTGGSMDEINDNRNPWSGGYADRGTHDDVVGISDTVSSKKTPRIVGIIRTKLFNAMAKEYVRRYKDFKMPTVKEFVDKLSTVRFPMVTRVLYGPAPKDRRGVTLDKGAWFYLLDKSVYFKNYPDKLKIMKKFVVCALYYRIVKKFSGIERAEFDTALANVRREDRWTLLATLKYWITHVFEPETKLPSVSDKCTNPEDAMYRGDRPVLSLDKPVFDDNECTTYKDNLASMELYEDNWWEAMDTIKEKRAKQARIEDLNARLVCQDTVGL
jgi:hypothetical protein